MEFCGKEKKNLVFLCLVKKKKKKNEKKRGVGDEKKGEGRGGGGGGGGPLIGLNGYMPLSRVWFSGSCVLNRVYNFNI